MQQYAVILKYEHALSIFHREIWTFNVHYLVSLLCILKKQFILPEGKWMKLHGK